MNLSSYLFIRSNSPYWQLRWMVPKAARAALGKNEFTKSLGVAERSKAETLAFPILSSWRMQVEAALTPSTKEPTRFAPRPATDVEIVGYLHERTYEVHRRVYAAFAKGRIKDQSSDFDAERQEIASLRRLFQQRLFLESTSGYIKFHEAELRDRGLLLPTDEAERKKVAGRILRTLLAAAQSVEAQMDVAEFTPPPFIVAAMAREANVGAGETVLDLFERYAAQRLAEAAKRPDGIKQDRTVITQFAGFVGANRRLDSITRHDVRGWRDTLATLPRNFRKSRNFKDLQMHVAAAKGAADGARPLSAITQNRYMSAVSPLFAWAVTNGYVEANPCDGLFLDINKQANPYPVFSADELNQMLSSPLFVGFRANGTEHEPGSVISNDWRKWIPLICLFTGARIGEVSQLRIDDVRKEHGRWFLDIRNDTKTGQRTKSGKSRLVPIHRTLEDIGFLRFHDLQLQAASGSDQRQLFPELKANDRDQIGAMPSRFWRKYLSKIGMKDGSDGRGSHSFRHTIADELRAAGYLDDEFGPLILGHSKSSVTAGYGRLPQGTADMLCRMIDSITFQDVNFDKLRVRAA